MLAIMPILASEALQCEKNILVKNINPVGIEPWPLITSDSKFNTLLSGVTSVHAPLAVLTWVNRA